MSKDLIKEAQRCLQCKNPQCQKGCPIATDIPGFISSFLSGSIDEAGQRIFENNPLSIICSLVCPHEHQCEGHCILGKKGDPVKISNIENYVSEYFLTRGSEEPKVPLDSRIAVIGSGPAGLTAAFYLAGKGHKITLFEAQDRVGGFLRYGIPEFRLSKNILDKIGQKLLSMGVKIRPNTLIGPVITIDTLFEDGYDAVFIGTGVWRPNVLRIKGESLGHVHYAIDYLRSPEAYNLGNKVCVVGGGNSAMDVARTVIRNGAKDVMILYRRDRESMPARDVEIDMAKIDGVKFQFFTSPIEILDNGIKCVKTAIVDDNLQIVPDSEFIIPADSVLIAASQGPQKNIVSTTEGIDINDRGLLITDTHGMTTREGVYASGDVVTGAKNVVEAVRMARDVAEEIHHYVQEKLK
ncbi:MAG: dihydropyrimidine dehydrogenase [Anaerosolibacter sp.]|jgi:glutamate synthase (NADPH/NADH) small chain|uniref:NAD(P)-dependent oxidoreductase n=1 Tax=Anaerosolibacter sp. TaxID=1872527 RepID=UPI002612BBE0|nr:NAD(P)-dependent oxidoreductase [Anaerosolibacter sp.]MDF2546631.1 dihydropyrimidine dehydrogenase [Anaerosolibacter sp.]